MRTRDAALAFGPPLLYPLKGAATRARSLLWLLARSGQVGSGLRVLFYHRVASAKDPLCVSPERFREQMEALAASGYQVLDLLDAVRRLFASGLPRHGVVALSFDDGYRDVAENALPVLERHGFRATVFVAPGLIDGTAPLTWYRQPPPLLDWPEIVDLERSGTFRFEAHSVTHRNLVALEDDEAWREIADSKSLLERRLGRTVEAFCYPGGVSGEREHEYVRAAGYRFGFSCEPGRIEASSNPHALPRLQIDARDGLLDFRSKLGGGHDSSLPGRGFYRRLRYGAPARTAPSSAAYRSR